MHARLPLALFATVLAASLAAAPAHAQRARTFVASYGQDSATCSFTQPCRTFQTAYNNTAVGGEITAIDSAGFGPLGINHAITITSPTGVEAGIVPSSGADAIDIGAGPGDVVVLRGLTLEGGGGLNGGAGINFSSGGSLEILDCVIKDFFDGVLVKPTSGVTHVTIKNTTALNSGNAGIYITPHQTASAVATLYQVTAALNVYGIYLDGSQTSGRVDADIASSYAADDNTAGITLNAVATTFVANTTAVKSGTLDLDVSGSNFVLLSGDKIEFLGGSGTVTTNGTNLITAWSQQITFASNPPK